MPMPRMQDNFSFQNGQQSKMIEPLPKRMEIL